MRLRTANTRKRRQDWRAEVRPLFTQYVSMMQGPGIRFPYRTERLVSPGRWVRHTPKRT